MTVSVERPAPAPDLLTEADVRTAARALLRTPLLTAEQQPDDYALVRRHQDALVRLFADGLGYRLVVETGMARLYKTGLGADAGRGLVRRNGVAFTPRRYAMLALTLAALTRSRRQVMIDELVAAVRSAAVDAGVEVDLDAIGDRRALHSAIVALVDLGVLTERDGDLEHWADRRTESLLDVHAERLSAMVAAPLRGCSTPADVVAVTAAPSAAGGARVAIRRRLVEQPVLSTDDLTEEQAGWWRRNREREREWFRRWLGLDLELRAEGAVAIDPGGDLTDLAFPAAGSARHFALLLVAELVDGVRGSESRPPTWARVTLSSARQAGDRVFAQWQRGLRREYQANPDGAFIDALAILDAMGLLRRQGSDLFVHAAAARYAPRPQWDAPSPSGEMSLFAEEP